MRILDFGSIVLSDYIQLLILIAVVSQGGIALHAFRKQNKLENARATLQAMQSICALIDGAADRAFDSISAGEVSYDDLEKQDKEALMIYLGGFEDIAVGVNSDIYDLEIVDKTLGGVILRSGDRFSVFIDKIREEQGIPTLFKEFLLLREKITSRRKKEDLPRKELSRKLID